jgi:hypothetical protein
MNSDLDDVCSICLDTINENNLCKTNCNHSYCKSCIDRWFDKQKVSCPMCRTKITYFMYDNRLNRVVFIGSGNNNNNIGNNHVVVTKKTFFVINVISTLSIFTNAVLMLYCSFHK